MGALLTGLIVKKRASGGCRVNRCAAPKNAHEDTCKELVIEEAAAKEAGVKWTPMFGVPYTQALGQGFTKAQALTIAKDYNARPTTKCELFGGCPKTSISGGTTLSLPPTMTLNNMPTAVPEILEPTAAQLLLIPLTNKSDKAVAYRKLRAEQAAQLLMISGVNAEIDTPKPAENSGDKPIMGDDAKVDPTSPEYILGTIPNKVNASQREIDD